jgi:hypothetical protein
MKHLLALAILTISSAVGAQTFNPESNMQFSCIDSVSNYSYHLTIVDIGDEEGKIVEFKKFPLITAYDNVVFNENSEESSFVAFKEGKVLFSIVFPNNDLKEAYYADGGDSRAMDCKIL